MKHVLMLESSWTTHRSLTRWWNTCGKCLRWWNATSRQESMTCSWKSMLRTTITCWTWFTRSSCRWVWAAPRRWLRLRKCSSAKFRLAKIDASVETAAFLKHHACLKAEWRVRQAFFRWCRNHANRNKSDRIGVAPTGLSGQWVALNRGFARKLAAPLPIRLTLLTELQFVKFA